MTLYYSVFFFIFGAVFGSFFNVVGLRLPKKEPFHDDRSYCPHCKTQLTGKELIPIVSYIIQGGKCRTCKQKISPLYPIVELATALLFLYSFLHFNLRIELITAILLISLLMIVYVSDLTYMLIPNRLLLFFLPLFIIVRIYEPLSPWYDAIIGAFVGYGLIAIIIIVSKGGMGAGDMKLFGLLGIVLGWKLVLLTFFLSALIGAIVGGFLIVTKKVKRKQPIPFGPYIVIATIISYFFGEHMVTFYVSLF